MKGRKEGAQDSLLSYGKREQKSVLGIVGIAGIANIFLFRRRSSIQNTSCQIHSLWRGTTDCFLLLSIFFLLLSTPSHTVQQKRQPTFTSSVHQQVTYSHFILFLLLLIIWTILLLHLTIIWTILLLHLIIIVQNTNRRRGRVTWT